LIKTCNQLILVNMTSYVYLFPIPLGDYFAAVNTGVNINKLINCIIKVFKELKMH